MEFEKSYVDQMRSFRARLIKQRLELKSLGIEDVDMIEPLTGVKNKVNFAIDNWDKFKMAFETDPSSIVGSLQMAQFFHYLDIDMMAVDEFIVDCKTALRDTKKFMTKVQKESKKSLDKPI